MGDDIVARLRRRTTWTWEAEEVIDPLDAAAADEIERLRAAGDALVAAIRNHDLTESHIKAWEEARRG